MTNGEKLKEIFPYLESDKTDLVKVLNIDNLKSWWNAEYKEPTTKNNLGADAVSRQAVLDLIADYDLSMGQVVKGIHALPSVTPIRPKGHWIGHREHCENLGVIPSGLGVYEWCSNCDCGIDVREWHRNHYNYCPNCGSYNRGDSNGNE